MCTVTYIPHTNGFYFTSSRDEQASRATIAPQKYLVEGIELVFPRDERAGGTWIASSLKGKTACLLNGAFERHQRKESYAKSRGLILLESFQYSTTPEFADTIDLNNIEPFTLLTLDYSDKNRFHFYEFRWDGEKKYLKKLDTDTCQIWSSATLYLPTAQLMRKQLFENWIEKHKDLPDKNILNFHTTKHGLKENEDIIMKGILDLMTVSISQVRLDNNGVTFNYFDRVNNTQNNYNLNESEFSNA